MDSGVEYVDGSHRRWRSAFENDALVWRPRATPPFRTVIVCHGLNWSVIA